MRYVPVSSGSADGATIESSYSSDSTPCLVNVWSERSRISAALSVVRGSTEGSRTKTIATMVAARAAPANSHVRRGTARPLSRSVVAPRRSADARPTAAATRAPSIGGTASSDIWCANSATAAWASASRALHAPQVRR